MYIKPETEQTNCNTKENKEEKNKKENHVKSTQNTLNNGI